MSRSHEHRSDYLYDDVGELYSARTYDSLESEVLAERYGYDYDPAWNLNKRTNNATVSSFNVNNQNQLTSSPEGSHSHDANGNMTTAGELHLGYDDENQMVTAIVMATDWMTGSKTDYTYDGKMRLRKAVDYSWNWIGGTNGTWSLINEKRYIYDGMLVVQERTSANTPSVTYTRGNDLSGTLQGAGGIGGMLARSQSYSAGSWLTHHFYHADGNGNITYLVNSSQTLGASYKYDPFGGTISSSGTYAGANRYRFSSKEVSLSNGTYYYGYRWYHPNLQRWLNRDPIHDISSISRDPRAWGRARSAGATLDRNHYRFVQNTPTGLIDPFGLNAMGPFDDYCKGLKDQIKLLEKMLTNPIMDKKALLTQLGDLYALWDEYCDDGGEDPDPFPVCPPKEEEECAPGFAKVAVGVGVGVGGSYVIYRCVRLIPSLLPPLWPTLPPNLAIP